MRKHSPCYPVFLILFLTLMTGLARADTVSIFTWEEYLSDDVIEAFESATGHTIKQVYFDNEDERDTVVSRGGAIAFDLVMVDDWSLKKSGDDRLFRRLGTNDVDNLNHLNQDIQKNCHNSGVAYGWGTTGIAYRESVYPDGIDTWAQFLSPVHPAGQRVLMTLDAVDSIAVTLVSQGFSPFSESKDELKLAYEVLKNQQEYAGLNYGYGVTYAFDHEADSDMAAALVWSGDLYQIAEATGQDDWVYTVPTEGTMLWVDCLALPTGKSPKQATLDFLSFINRPEIAAQNAEDIWFATTNQGALAFVGEEYKGDTELFPPQDVIERSHYYQPVDNKSYQLRERIVMALEKAKSE